MSSSNATTFPNDMDRYMYLRKHDNQYAMQVLAAIIVLVILMLVGFVGNSLVCYLYLFKFKRSTPRCFIVAPAVFDLISCTISIPIEIADMMFHYTFGAYTLCKFARAVVVFSSMASGTVLFAIAVDRYKKICRPLEIQTTIFMAKVAVMLCSILAVIVAAPAVFIYGSKTVTTDDIRVNGSDCSTADEYVGTTYPLIFNTVQSLIFISATITLSVLYSLIWQKLRRQQAFRQSASLGKDYRMSTSFRGLPQDRKISFSTSVSSSARLDPVDTVNDSKLENTDSHNTHAHLNGINTWKKSAAGQVRRNGDNGTTPRKKRRTKSRRDVKGSRRTTFMLFLITLVFVLSFFPHLGLMAARALNKDVFKDLKGVEATAYNLFLRSYFINSASNFIIYSIYNSHFRRELKLLCCKFTCRS